MTPLFLSLTLAAAQSAAEDDPDLLLPRFVEVAATSGLDFVSLSGDPGKPRIVDQYGQGVAWFDYDGDGWLDLFVPNGSTLAAWRGEAENTFRDRLFRNRGDGTFEDVTDAAGLGSTRWGAGVAVGDVDNDGDPDLYVCNLGKNQLWRNNGDGTFTDVTEEAGGGIEFDHVTPGAALGDIDLDGDLDLYVARYIHFDPADPPDPYGKRIRDMMVSLGPKAHEGAPDRLYVNVGGGQFEERSEASGLIADRERGFTVLICDMTFDDLPDIFVACDESRNLFYRGEAGGTFIEESDISGLSVGKNGKEEGCMGVGIADVNGDQVPDFYITNFYGQQNAMYVSCGDGFWEDRSEFLERGGSSRNYVGWGTGFFDLDLDGDEDLLAFNGHIHPQLDEEEPAFATYLEAPLVYLRRGERDYVEVAERIGSPLADLHCARGTGFADYDEDGDVDFVVTDIDGPIRLFRNDTETAGHFLKVQLQGADGVNPDAFGARVDLVVEGVVQTRWILGVGSYLCHNDARAHFGLGTAKAADSLTVRWPGGRVETIEGPIAADRTLLIRTGEGLVAEAPRGQPLPGWKKE